MLSYHDTTGLGVRESKAFELKAKAQEAKVLEYFRAHHTEMFTPEQIGMELMPEAPRTSWGRCLSNLTKDGFLEKTNHRTQGMYGRPICYWRLATEPRTQDWIGSEHGPQ